MRYVLIDRITNIDPGRAIVALKNITATDALLNEYSAGVWALPPAMVLEAMAQAAGVLVAAAIDCRAQPVLAKIQPFSTERLAIPGDQVVVDVRIRELRDGGCRTEATARIGSALLAEAAIFLALVPVSDSGRAQLRARMARTFPGWFTDKTPAEALP